MQLTPQEINTFQEKIHQFYKEHKRNFPWRETHDPYKILVSEMMLQQTQTSRVKEKYAMFLEHFPTFSHLANSSQSELLSVWQGLGYNRRALYLKSTAQIVCEKHNGTLPHLKEELIALPGIGKNTAGAVINFAFNTPQAFIETNIRRVFIYEYFRETEQVNDAILYPLIESTIDKENPRDWFYALMDYGVSIAKENPNPNRKSAHYKKQSQFEGSARQTRGTIIRLLTKSSLSEKELKDQINSPHFEKVIDQLQKEGFIYKKGDAFFL